MIFLKQNPDLFIAVRLMLQIKFLSLNYIAHLSFTTLQPYLQWWNISIGFYQFDTHHFLTFGLILISAIFLVSKLYEISYISMIYAFGKLIDIFFLYRSKSSILLVYVYTLDTVQI